MLNKKKRANDVFKGNFLRLEAIGFHRRLARENRKMPSRSAHPVAAVLIGIAYCPYAPACYVW
jgi:hypothetical protein